MEDRNAVVPAAGEERPDTGIQVRGICGRADVRPVSKNTAEPGTERRNRMRHLPMACTAMAGLFLSAAGPAAAQTAPSTAKAYKLARTADGHPDLQGMYDLATITPVERPMGAPAAYGK